MRPPFHQGERFVQWLLKSPAKIDAWARVALRDELISEHQLFFRELPHLIVAARDNQGRPWCSILSGEPGFATAKEQRRLRVEAQPRPGDPLHGALLATTSVGLLGIELHSRRRNRLNGQILSSDDTSFEVAVGQSYGNCPKYIVRRAWRPEKEDVGQAAAHFSSLSPSAVALLEQSDTFFIATGFRPPGANGVDQLDASHRGGAPGLIRVEDGTSLSFPDYSGNNLYNTLGNLVKDPRAGLLVIDFQTGGLLHLQGEIEIDWLAQDPGAKPPVKRRLRFCLKSGVWRERALPLRFAKIPSAAPVGGATRSA